MELGQQRLRNRRRRVVKRKKSKTKSDKRTQAKYRKVAKLLKVEKKQQAVVNLFQALQNQLGAPSKQIISQ